MAKVIKEVDWNGHHYTFTNTYKNTGTRSHDILTMEDENGNSWTGETTWINRPWHRFDLEEAFTEIVGKAFGPKATELILEINNNAHSVENAIDNFFANFKPEDITAIATTESASSTEARKASLAKYLKVGVEELEEISENEFSLNGETYRVLTDDEAEEEFDREARSYWEDAGIESLPDWLQDWIFENALDEDALYDIVREEIEQYIWQLSDEDVANECIDAGLREEDDLYVEDEDGLTSELRDDVDFDELREELIDEQYDQVENFGEYLKDMGYDDSFFLDYIDEDAVIEAIKDMFEVNGEGRGILSWYDGAEIDLDNGLYAYRVE